jgi:2'-5' RNA ligase
MIRLFVALALPQPLQLQLASLDGGVPGARWVKPEYRHLTLRFIGEVDRSIADDLDVVLGGIEAPSFELTLSGVGQFGKPDAARILWAGVEPNGALDHLQMKIEAAVARAGLPVEQRRFSPHVTLARLRRAPGNRIEQFVADHAGFRAEPITIDRFTLFSSFLSSSGAIYTPEAEYPLAGQMDIEYADAL